MPIKSSVASDIPLSLPEFPILMESHRGTVFMFMNPQYAICLHVGGGSQWSLGEGKKATMTGMLVFKGVMTLENE